MKGKYEELWEQAVAELSEIVKFKGFPGELTIAQRLEGCREQLGGIWGDKVMLQWRAFQAEGTAGAKT